MKIRRLPDSRSGGASQERRQRHPPLPVPAGANLPGPRARHDGWTGERRRVFLETLAAKGSVRDACRVAGLSNTSAYRLRRADPAFGAAWDVALKQAATSLEAVAFARAVEGVEEPTIRRGEVVSSKRRYSDSLLRLLLQGSNPEKFGRTGAGQTVQAREEREAREEKIRQEAYAHAFRVMVAEYRFHCENVFIHLYLLRKFSAMHQRMCGNPWCLECHPDREKDQVWKPVDYPAYGHDPIGPVIHFGTIELAEYEQETIRARAAGEHPRIDEKWPDLPSWEETLNTPPPVWRYRPPADEEA